MTISAHCRPELRPHLLALDRQNHLMGVIGGNIVAIKTFKRILSGEQPLSRNRLIIAAHDGIDLMAQYRQRLSDAEHKIAAARAELSGLIVPPRPVTNYVQPEEQDPQQVKFGKRGRLRFFAPQPHSRLLISTQQTGD